MTIEENDTIKIGHYLYRLANDADGIFHEELVRQFGTRESGTMRYLPKYHDEQTKIAAHAFHVATANLRNHWEQQRKG